MDTNDYNTERITTADAVAEYSRWFTGQMSEAEEMDYDYRNGRMLPDVKAMYERLVKAQQERDALKAFYDLMMTATGEGLLLDFLRAKSWMGNDAAWKLRDEVLPAVRALQGKAK